LETVKLVTTDMCYYRIIKLRMMKLVKHVGMGRMRNVYKYFVEKPKGKRPL